MSDEQENVEAGSETSGEQAAADNSAVAETTETSTTEVTADAGVAAEQTQESGSETSGQIADAGESRTGFAEKGLNPGDECLCPDGRKGTVHRFDAGLICIPNHDQA